MKDKDKQIKRLLKGIERGKHDGAFDAIQTAIDNRIEFKIRKDKNITRALEVNG